MTNFQKLCKQLELKIQASYTEGTSLEDAEKLAAEFLNAMLAVSTELKTSDLDSRLRKSGVKAIRAAIYLDIIHKSAQKADKKPTESQIAAMIDSDDIVKTEQETFDKAEVDRNELERIYSVFQNAHIFYRGVSRGKFD